MKIEMERPSGHFLSISIFIGFYCLPVTASSHFLSFYYQVTINQWLLYLDFLSFAMMDSKVLQDQTSTALSYRETMAQLA